MLSSDVLALYSLFQSIPGHLASFSHEGSKIGVFLTGSKNFSSDVVPNVEVSVVVYRITGKQLFFNVDESYCEECELTVRRIVEVSKNLPDIHVKLSVKPWLNNIFRALLKGGWHAPVVLVDGKRISQGVVPNDSLLTNAIVDAADRDQRRQI